MEEDFSYASVRKGTIVITPANYWPERYNPNERINLFVVDNSSPRPPRQLMVLKKLSSGRNGKPMMLRVLNEQGKPEKLSIVASGFKMVQPQS